MPNTIEMQNITSVPFIDLRFEEGFEEKVSERWNKCLANRSFIAGDASKELERKILDFSKAKHFVPCANGTDAIQIALRSVGVGAGDVVLLPDFTFWATYEAVINVSASPVLVDISESDFQMDFDLFVQAAEKYKPKAAVIVHLYGWCSERLKEFREFCSKKDIFLIEDGAQALGTLYEGRPIFESAFLATTSFYPAKVLGAAGDAGGVFSNNKALAEKCMQLTNHGRSSHYGHEYVGWNSRMDEVQAHFLCESLNNLQKRIDSRKKAEEQYQQVLGKTDINSLPLKIQSAPSNVSGNGYLQVSLANTSYKNLSAQLLEHGIKTGNVYPSPMSKQRGAENPILVTENKVAEHISPKVINLPLFPYIKVEEVDYVCSCLNQDAQD